MHEVGRLVGEGESVTHEGVRFVVETAEHNRILEVRVELSDTGTETGTESGTGTETVDGDGEPPDEGPSKEEPPEGIDRRRGATTCRPGRISPPGSPD
jgi:hypothetical protein